MALKHNRIYRIWMRIRTRCNNPNTQDYKDYGGRGIKVCNEWDSFESFEAWARSNGYADDLSIDRIDTNGNYCPDNCRWATNKEQANNKRNNKLITFNGKTQTVAQWADEKGWNYSTLEGRLQNYGWDIEKALEKELGKTRGKQYTAFGKTQNVAHWAEEYHIPYAVLESRLNHGWTIEEALTKPIQYNKSRKNVGITAFGKTMLLWQWAEEYGINKATLSSRLRSGWNFEDALTTPTNTRYSRRK